MSRNIPRVQLWRVTYFRDGMQIFQHESHAPTKLFARWNARDAFIQSGAWREAGYADKIRVGLIRKGN
jgi:accessory colonization factor AcfC